MSHAANVQVTSLLGCWDRKIAASIGYEESSRIATSRRQTGVRLECVWFTLELKLFQLGGKLRARQFLGDCGRIAAIVPRAAVVAQIALEKRPGVRSVTTADNGRAKLSFQPVIHRYLLVLNARWGGTPVRERLSLANSGFANYACR